MPRSTRLRDAYGHHLVVAWEARGERLAPARRRRRRDRIDPPRRSARSLRDPRQGARAGRRPRPDRSRIDARRSCSMAGRRTRWRSCPTTAPSWPWRSPVRASRGASSTSSARRRARSVRATSTSPGSRRTRSGRWSAAPSAPTRSPTCSIGPRRFAAWRPTSAAGSTSIGSCPAWSITRWSCSRAIGPPSSSSSPTATWRRGQPQPVGRLPRQRSRLPGAVAAGRRGGGAPAAVRGRLPKRPARRGRPGGGRPGGLRHPVHGAADGRHAICSACSTSTTTGRITGRRTSSIRSGRWRPRRASRSRPRRTSSGWRRGPPSSSRSSSWGRG